MKHIVYIFILLFSVQMNGQNSIAEKKIKVELLTLEKTSNDTIISSIVETYSGGKRIQTAVSDFDGISIFSVNTKDILNDKIRLKIYGPKCSVFEKEYNFKTDLITEIKLEYGESTYTHYTQMRKMLRKLNIQIEIGEE